MAECNGYAGLMRGIATFTLPLMTDALFLTQPVVHFGLWREGDAQVKNPEQDNTGESI
jgi:hypothetical protein